MGERQRGEGKPETLLARNAKLASNTGAAAASSIARTTTGSNVTSSAKTAIGNASSGSDVWNGAPTTMVTATASQANKLALNSPTTTARPSDAAVSN
jgi:hypothetical protein